MDVDRLLRVTDEEPDPAGQPVPGVQRLTGEPVEDPHEAMAGPVAALRARALTAGG